MCLTSHFTISDNVEMKKYVACSGILQHLKKGNKRSHTWNEMNRNETKQHTLTTKTEQKKKIIHR